MNQKAKLSDPFRNEPMFHIVRSVLVCTVDLETPTVKFVPYRDVCFRLPATFLTIKKIWD